ncbi:iron-siderophore ABC transporter substrate-binding protein [Pseudooceanicola aestuarii]|uniref:iron-siderophore ABC transporter substrate-binding protein n=1 Tax=Pseudooceanicola aestuarii TaxID=2697319 RepID=UPI0013D86E8B|nr:iron-siderophore ABC transporter substrate-binding protein [Pseudooceanicola aestuarii]
MHRRTMMLRAGAALALTGLTPLGLVTGAAPARADTDWPIRIDHAFGTTVIPARPQRVATVNWANHEVPLALGVVPVGFARAGWGDTDGDGLMPWVAARLKELGAETPRLYDEGDGIDFEGVAASAPDVILAAYSGIGQRDYDTLSQIAPVVVYRDGPWVSDWRETIRLNSLGMGMAEEGEALIAQLDARIAQTAAAHPEFAGEKVMLMAHSAADLSTIGFYSANDPRLEFLQSLGLDLAQAVEATRDNGQFYGSISAENIDMFSDVTLLITYGGPAVEAALQANPLTAQVPAVANGAIAKLQASDLGVAANPTPLSLPSMIDAYADLLSRTLNGE